MEGALSENSFICFRSGTPFHRTCTEPGAGAGEGGPVLAETVNPGYLAAATRKWDVAISVSGVEGEVTGE